MTALNAAILFNNSTGSDTTASGCGPATAVTITLQTSAGSNTANASGSLSSISAGDLMYVSSFTGRKFNVIASVQPLGGTITFDDNWDDSASGVSGYVGGKRATFSGSVQILNDAHGGWTIETETDQTLTAQFGGTATGSADSLIEINCNNKTISKSYSNFWSGAMLLRNYMRIRNANIETSISNNGIAVSQAGSAGNSLLENCTIGATGSGTFAYGVYGGLTCRRVSFQNITQAVFASASCELIECVFLSNGTGVQASHHVNACGCLFANQTGNGITFTSSGRYLTVQSCLFYGNGSDGINSAGSLMTDGLGGIRDCIFVSNTGYGINYTVSGRTTLIYQNAYFGNGSGETTGINNEIDSITLTADPFVDPTASPPDFNISDSAGGGATLRANNFSINTDTAVYPFRQYVSDAFGAGGGSAGTYHPLYLN